MRRQILLILRLVFISTIATACAGESKTPTATNDEIVLATMVAATLSAVQSTTPEASPTNTLFPTETFVPTPIPPESLDRTNIESVLKWITYAITENKPEMFIDVIGDDGVDLGGKYQSSVTFPGHNNSDIVVGELKQALQNATPLCTGYETYIVDSPDISKASIFFSGLKYDWGDYIVVFTFFYMENSWELVGRAPIPAETWPNVYQRLWVCP